MPEIKLTVDAVVFTIMHQELKILLVKRQTDPFKGKYALPGGFVEYQEELEDAVKRELQEETNVKNVFLKRLKPFGKVNRDPRGRVVSISFLALVSADNINLQSSNDASNAQWKDSDALPPLAFDHKDIITDALQELKFLIQTTNIAYQILSKKFTLSEMQRLYECVLGTELDKRNFRKKIAELDLVKETGEMKRDGAYRPAMLYSFKQQKFETIKDKMNVFM